VQNARLAFAEKSAFRQFADAVVAFSDDPGPDGLERYLAASRALEEARRSREPATQTRASGKGSRAAGRRSRRAVA
jgi:hypothetical protein